MSDNQSNQMSTEDYDLALEELAQEKGRGGDAQVRAHMLLVEAAYHGKYDMVKDKHGAGMDDAARRAQKYVNDQAGAKVYDAKNDSHQKTASCFRTCIKVGGMTKLGPGEPLNGMNELLDIRAKVRKQAGGNKLVDDAANTLVRWARAQLKSQTPLSTEELEVLARKKVPGLATAEEILASTRKTLQKLYNGAAANGTAQDASQEVQDALAALTTRLVEIAKEKGGKAKPAAKDNSQAVVSPPTP